MGLFLMLQVLGGLSEVCSDAEPRALLSCPGRAHRAGRPVLPALCSGLAGTATPLPLAARRSPRPVRMQAARADAEMRPGRMLSSALPAPPEPRCRCCAVPSAASGGEAVAALLPCWGSGGRGQGHA